MGGVTDAGKPVWRLNSTDSALYDVLALLRASFKYMDGRIDPPSSIHRLTVQRMQDFCQAGGEIWVMGRPLFGCMFLKPEAERLYLGKLAVDQRRRGQGICRTLIDHAECRAAALGKSVLELQTRIELTENHRVFSRLGFNIVSTSSHDGYNTPTDFLLRKKVSLSADS